MHFSTILSDSSCIANSKSRSTRNMAWIKEKGESKSYLVMKKFVIQCCFECLSLKQMKIRVGNDGCLKHFSSTMLVRVQISICHGWTLMKQSWRLLLQSRKTTCKGCQIVGKWWNKPKGIVCFEGFLQILRNEEKSIWERVSNFCVFEGC